MVAVRSPPNGQHRRQAMPLLRQGRVTDGIDAAMRMMQPSSSDTPADRGSAESDTMQLGNRDDAMLRCGYLGNLSIRLGDFRTQCGG